MNSLALKIKGGNHASVIFIWKKNEIEFLSHAIKEKNPFLNYEGKMKQKNLETMQNRDGRIS